jgi:hypothetical protein
MVYTFALIILFHVHLHVLDHLDHHCMCISTSCDLVAIVTPLGVKHALTSQSMSISIAYIFIITCNIS